VSDFEELSAENQALRQRIAALEAELEARPRIERSPLVALLDAMPMLVGSMSADGTSEFFSAAFGPWLVAPRASLVGTGFVDALIPSLRAHAQAMLADAKAGDMSRRELSLPDADGAIRDLLVTLIPRRLGGVDANGYVWVAEDQTQKRVSDEALRASELRFRMAADAAGLGVWDRDLADDAVVVSDLGRRIYGLPADGEITLAMLRGAVHPEDRQLVIGTALRHMDPQLKSREPCTYRVLWPSGEVRWVQAHGEAVFEVRDGVEVPLRYVGMLQDVTEQTRSDLRRRFLLHELNHRVKNTLASVQSIAHLSLRGAQSVEAVRARLTDRLLALAAAHDILTREDWRGADIADIVGVAIAPFDTPATPRFLVDGPSAALAPKAAVALALALHELATNAVKYGALSLEAGEVEIAWRIGPGETPILRVDWRERGGPPVVPPARSGFGARLLTQGLATEFGSAARLSFQPEGLACRIAVPLSTTPLLELD
jgi:two-component sensor histidine kinase